MRAAIFLLYFYLFTHFSISFFNMLNTSCKIEKTQLKDRYIAVPKNILKSYLNALKSFC